jgi:hypothetical protein
MIMPVAEGSTSLDFGSITAASTQEYNLLKHKNVDGVL